MKNQYETLKDHLNKESDVVNIFAMKRSFTSPIGSLIKYIKAFFRIFPYYFKGYDVVHLHFFFPLILVIFPFILFRAKIVVTFHGSDIHNYFNNIISKKFFQKVLSKIHVVIAVGQELSDEIEDKLNRKPEYILSAGVDTKIFYPTNTSKEFDFLFVGSFIDRKGVNELVEAIKLVNDKNIKYAFVGSGELKFKIENIARSYNIEIIENQTQDQLRDLYNSAKFFILPSKYEPFGLVASEALFCGTPIIVSGSGGLKEQLIEHINGFLIKDVNPMEIKKSIILANQILEPEYLELSQNSLNTNNKNSLDYVSKQLISIYENLIS